MFSNHSLILNNASITLTREVEIYINTTHFLHLASIPLTIAYNDLLSLTFIIYSPSSLTSGSGALFLCTHATQLLPKVKLVAVAVTAERKKIS
jgi:hypothetical protein